MRYIQIGSLVLSKSEKTLVLRIEGRAKGFVNLEDLKKLLDKKVKFVKVLKSVEE